jgi:hypothetical protein
MITYGFTDVHENWKILKREVDNRRGTDVRFVLNGDYFDHHLKPNINVAEDMAKLLVDEYLYDSNFSVHWGNHDPQYFWSANGSIMTSGSCYKKAEALSKIFSTKDRHQFKFFSFVGKYLVSHAGINNQMLHPTTGVGTDYLLKLGQSAVRQWDIGQDHMFTHAGRARGGSMGNHGGIIWQDWNDEFMPIDDVNQIVGHTLNRLNKEPLVRTNHTEKSEKSQKSQNFCFDGQMQVCFRIEDDKDVEFEYLSY